MFKVNKNHKPLIFTILLQLVISFSFSQTNIDSLKIVTSSRAHDTLKFAAYNSIINFYWKSDLKQALAFSKINLSFALKKNIDKYIAIAYNNLSGTYYFMGDYQNANLYNFKTLNIRLKKQQDGTTVGSKKSIASTYNNIASIYLKLANYTKSIEYNLLALKIKEDINDSLGMARSYTNIGNVYEKINKRTLALKFQKQALELMLILNDGHGIGAAYNNIGNILLKENDYKNAKINFEKAIEIRKKIEDVEGLYTTYNNLGELNYELKNYVAAKKYFELAWEYFSESSDPYLRTSILINLGEIYKFVNQEKKAEEYLKIAIGIAQKNKMPEIEKAAYDALAGMYFNLRNFEKAYTNLRMYNDINDTIYKLANSKKTAELQALYDDAQKTNQIESLKKEKIESDLENSKKELEIQKQKSFKNLLLSGLVVLILLGFLLFNRFSIKSKLNKKLEFQNQQIAAKNNDITNSINYAKRIQDAILPSIKYVNNYIPDNFILYKPKDIVAGDFYWFERVNGISFIAAADCTGHGVPGAMVSVVCSNALNRAVFEFGITEPGLILDKTRELVLDTFSKSDEEVKDGMDISLIAIHETENGSNKREIKWAGANNPLWLIQNGELLEIKSHKQSVGVTINPTNFPTHNLDLSLGDTLYLFTDGFQDQFGGENAKKFKAAKFKDLLVSINMYSVQKQKQLIENCFQEWKGDLEQVDDICVIGIRL